MEAKIRTYTVKTGDTLSAIAKRNGVAVKQLAEANNITDINNISIGMVLVIPEARGEGGYDEDPDFEETSNAPNVVVGSGAVKIGGDFAGQSKTQTTNIPFSSGSAQVGRERLEDEEPPSKSSGGPPRKAASRPRGRKKGGDDAPISEPIPGLLRGIDVSSNQSEVDWGKIETGISFAFIRATNAETIVDPLFEKNWKGAKGLGVMRGAYHVVGLMPTMDAKKQAEHFIQTFKSLNDPGELPPVLDIVSNFGASVPNGFMEFIQTWLETVENELGKNPIIYARSEFLRDLFKQTNNVPAPWFGKSPLWLAQYGDALREPALPPLWTEWKFWQYTDKGNVKGIEAPASLNFFNGEFEDLRAFASGVTLQRINFALNDRPEGPDLLDYERYAEAFAKVLDGEFTQVPLTIGIYASWGMGKSFLLGKIRERLKQVGEQKMKLGWGTHSALNLVQGLVQRHKDRIKQDEEKKRTNSIWMTRRERRLSSLEKLAGRLERSGEGSRFGFIDFNAWVYSGSENLWAGLVTRLYDKIEEFYGPRLVQQHRLQRSLERMLKTFVKSLWLAFAFGLPALLYSWLEGAEMIQENWDAVRNAFMALSGSSLLINIPNIYKALRELVNSLVFARAQELANLSSRKDFKEQIGFMADIQSELREISKLIRESDRRRNQKTRFVIFVDDLDRCPPDKAVEVLEAIMLLLSDIPQDPFIIFLAIDARVLVKAIEMRYGKMLSEAGVSGYEFLDKIVQIPFRLPPSNDPMIRGYVDSLLWQSREAQDAAKLQEPKLLSQTPPGDTTPPSADGQPAPRVTEGRGGQPEAPTPPRRPQEAPKPIVEERPFDDEEKRAFERFVPCLSRNPRRVKRIVNIYRLSRLLLPKDVIPPTTLIKWVILTEQWPFRAAWMMQQLNDDIQAGRLLSKSLSLPTLYQNVRAKVESEKSRALALLDEDADLFELFIGMKPDIVGDDIYRHLQVITFNLNPAMESEVLKAALKVNDAPQHGNNPDAAQTG